MAAVGSSGSLTGAAHEPVDPDGLDAAVVEEPPVAAPVVALVELAELVEPAPQNEVSATTSTSARPTTAMTIHAERLPAVGLVARPVAAPGSSPRSSGRSSRGS